MCGERIMELHINYQRQFGFLFLSLLLLLWWWWFLVSWCEWLFFFFFLRLKLRHQITRISLPCFTLLLVIGFIIYFFRYFLTCLASETLIVISYSLLAGPDISMASAQFTQTADLTLQRQISAPPDVGHQRQDIAQFTRQLSTTAPQDLTQQAQQQQYTGNPQYQTPQF